MSNKPDKLPHQALSHEALDTLLDEAHFVEVPTLFTNRVMQEIDALPNSAQTTPNAAAHTLQDSPETRWWQWAALIGGGIPALLQVLVFIFSAWNVASVG